MMNGWGDQIVVDILLGTIGGEGVPGPGGNDGRYDEEGNMLGR